MAAKIQRLETTLMELGTEMFRLRHQISDMQHMQTQFIKTLSGLKTILDEKGVVSSDDFELAVDMTRYSDKADRLEKDHQLPSPKKEMH